MMQLPAWFDRHLPTHAAMFRRSRFYRFFTCAILVLLPIAVALAIYVQWQKTRHDPRRQAPNEITVIVGRTCPFSRELERALHTAGIQYRRLDVDDGDADGPARWAFYTVHARGIPVTVIGSEVVYGLRTRAVRDALASAGHDTSRLQFERETDGSQSPVRR
jgi:mycoredoxin